MSNGSDWIVCRADSGLRALCFTPLSYTIKSSLQIQAVQPRGAYLTEFLCRSVSWGVGHPEIQSLNSHTVIELGTFWRAGVLARARCWVCSDSPGDFNHAVRCLLWLFLAGSSYRIGYTKNNSLIVVTETYTCEYQGAIPMSLQMPHLAL